MGLVDIGRARKESFRSAVTAGLVVVSLLLPFLMTSWIESGDPLYAVNSRIGWYQESLDRPLEERGDTTGFLVSEARRAPVAFLETAFNGLTTYPLKYKWTGFEPWVTGLGRALGWLAVAGLFLFLWTPAGRLLLVVLFTSMIPYIFTWQVPNFALVHHLRYTMHVYPLLLVAAGFAVERAVTATRPVTLRTLVAKGRFKQSAVKAVVTLVLAVGLWSILNAFAYLRLREELRLQRGTIVFAGPRDRVFFRSGWYAPRTVGNVTARFAKARSARIWVPMLAGQAHRVTLRADPYDFLDGSPQHLGILINGVLLTIAPMTLDSDRVGEYVVDVPGDLVTGPLARLDLRATYAMRPGPVPVRQSKEGTDRDEGFDAFVDPDDEVSFPCVGGGRRGQLSPGFVSRRTQGCSRRSGHAHLPLDNEARCLCEKESAAEERTTNP